jgi:glycosyltransferase involved in cell wall biosynthesis
VRDGAERLDASLRSLEDFLCRQAYAAELVLVDDHSGPDAARVLERFARGTAGTSLIRNEANRGKGFTVACGMLGAQGRYRVFTDTDLAYGPDQIARILRVLESGSDVAIACRVLPESRYLMSPTFFHYLYTRHLMKCCAGCAMYRSWWASRLCAAARNTSKLLCRFQAICWAVTRAAVTT